MKLPKYLFWWEWVQKMIWDPFWWLILFVIILWVPFLRVWWWIFLPLMLRSQLKTLYLWWIDWDFDYAKTKWIMLEAEPWSWNFEKQSPPHYWCGERMKGCFYRTIDTVGKKIMIRLPTARGFPLHRTFI